MSELKFSPKTPSEYVSFFTLWNKELGFFRNIKYLLLELFFGVQISELLTDTNSVELFRREVTKLGEDHSDYGMVAGLSRFIPATLMTKFFEESIAHMIYHKYFQTYDFIISANETYKPSGSTPENEATGNFYRLNKSNAHQLVPYKGKLNLIWTSIETVATTITWIYTNSLEVTLLVTGVLEFARRFRI